MPVRTALWKVTAQPEQLPEAVLPSEKLLEDMIVAQSLLLSDAWMLIDRQKRTGLGGIGPPDAICSIHHDSLEPWRPACEHVSVMRRA